MDFRGRIVSHYAIEERLGAGGMGDQGDRDAATAAFRQALLQLRGRPQALGSGHLAVQALAGLARAGGGTDPLEEARRIFATRSGFDFHGFYGCSDEFTGGQLAAAEQALGGRA